MNEFQGESLYDKTKGEIMSIYEYASKTSSWPDVCNYVTDALERLGFIPTYDAIFLTDLMSKFNKKQIGHSWPTDPVTYKIIELAGEGLNRLLLPKNQFHRGIVIVGIDHPNYKRYASKK